MPIHKHMPWPSLAKRLSNSCRSSAASNCADDQSECSAVIRHAKLRQRGYPRWFTSVGAIVVAFSLTACGPPASQRSAENETSIEQTVASSALAKDRPSSQIGSWTSYSSIDPITDIETTVANRTFRTGKNTVELEVGCGDDKWITYTATAFDQNGDGAPLDWAFGPNGLEFTVQIRVDRDDATRWFTEKRRYSNQFKLSGPTKFLARGMALTMRFAMPNDDVTIFVDQGDPIFRNVVEPCLAREPEPAPAVATETEAETQPRPDVDAVPEPVSNLSPRASENSDGEPS